MINTWNFTRKVSGTANYISFMIIDGALET